MRCGCGVRLDTVLFFSRPVSGRALPLLGPAARARAAAGHHLALQPELRLHRVRVAQVPDVDAVVEAPHRRAVPRAAARRGGGGPGAGQREVVGAKGLGNCGRGFASTRRGLGFAFTRPGALVLDEPVVSTVRWPDRENLR